jgi:hypothetical protein
MIQGIRRGAIAAVSALTLGLGAAIWATTSASAAPAATPACSSSSLSVWVDASSANPGAGTTEYALEFTNISGKACTLYGYPGVSATNSSGKQLGEAADRNPEFAKKTVTIAAGATAHADLGWSEGEVYTAPGCDRETAALLKVYAPGDKAARDGFFDLPVCSNTKKDPYLFVTVVRSGPREDN